jgi:hypothetical protein
MLPGRATLILAGLILVSGCAHVSQEEQARIADEAAIRHAAYQAFFEYMPPGDWTRADGRVNCLGYGKTRKIDPDPWGREIEDEPTEGLKAFAAYPDLVAPASFCRPSGYWHPPPTYKGEPLKLGVRIIVEFIDRPDPNTAIASVGIWPVDLTSPRWGLVNDNGGWEVRLVRKGAEWTVEDRKASWAY